MRLRFIRVCRVYQNERKVAVTMPSERKPPPIDTGYGVADEDMTYGVEDSVTESFCDPHGHECDKCSGHAHDPCHTWRRARVTEEFGVSAVWTHCVVCRRLRLQTKEDDQ